MSVIPKPWLLLVIGGILALFVLPRVIRVVKP